MSPKIKRFAIVGTGGRATSFARPLTTNTYDGAQLVALCDVNPLRMQGFNAYMDAAIPSFTDFAEMVRETRPTHAIVCTPDFTHDEIIAQAFAQGLDAICEKPMATDAAKVRRIRELENHYGKQLTVAFNYRYNPYSAQIKQILMNNDLGEIRSISLEWLIDKVHGAEYFRRWHANMANSGGLFVHKATHHFDLVNWFIDAEPESVAAFGSLQVFGAMGPFRSERCATCPHAGGECPQEMVIHKEPQHRNIFDKLYWEAEAGDGYIRDRCVFRKEIDIFDTMNAVVRYRNGAQLSYALNAYSPVEGYRLAITGTNARLEACSMSKNTLDAGIMMEGETGEDVITIVRGRTREDITVEQIPVAKDPGAHGGGDKRMFDHLYREDLPDPLHQAAGSRAGAMSCLIGIAANRSIETGRVVDLGALS